MDVLHLFHAGGFMMYPLLLCSIIVVTIFIERFRFYHANRSNIEKLTKEIPELLAANDQEGLKAALKADGGIPAGVILSGAEQLSSKANQTAILEGAASHAAGVLKSYLNYLDVIVTLSPLMGLLGTVIGMIGSFNVLSVEEGQPFAITGASQKHLSAPHPAFSLPSSPLSPTPTFRSRYLTSFPRWKNWVPCIWLL